jgi:hypothetical protein
VANELKAAFKKLTPEQQTIFRDKLIDGQRSPDEWLTLLTPVAELDEQCDALRVSRAGFFTRRFARKNDVPNGLREFTMPLLPILREDHDPDTPLELRLDLSGWEQDRKKIGTGDPYKQGAYRKIVDTFYDDPWIEGHAKFVDGADIRFTVVDHVRSSRKTKRSSSGKIKTKKKSKKKIEFTVTCSFPARNYAAAGQPAPSGGVKKESVKADEERTVVKLNRVVEATSFYSTPQPELLLDLLANAYARVDPARRKKL